MDDDIAAGRAAGRIRKTELRLRLTHAEKSLRRVRCEVNGEEVDLSAAGKIRNRKGEEWLVVEDPPVKGGVNSVLVVLDGKKTPAEHADRYAPWPTLESCEIIVKTGS